MDMIRQCKVCVDPSSETRFSGSTWIRAAGCLPMTPSFPLPPPFSHGYRWPSASPVRAQTWPWLRLVRAPLQTTSSSSSPVFGILTECADISYISIGKKRLYKLIPALSLHPKIAGLCSVSQPSRQWRRGRRRSSGCSACPPVRAHAQRQEQHSASSDWVDKKSVCLSNLQDEVKNNSHVNLCGSIATNGADKIHLAEIYISSIILLLLRFEFALSSSELPLTNKEGYNLSS